MTYSDPSMVKSNYEREKLDYYPTPPWATQAVIPSLKDYISDLSGTQSYIWECACGEGHMSEVLKRSFRNIKIISSDIINRGYPDQTQEIDFLKFQNTGMSSGKWNIVTNPPYGKILNPFIEKALELTKPSKGVVAFLMRNEVDSAKGRAKFFSNHPAFAEKFVLLKRPRWVEYKEGDASPRHNYSWFIWDWNKDPEELPIIRYGL